MTPAILRIAAGLLAAGVALPTVAQQASSADGSYREPFSAIAAAHQDKAPDSAPRSTVPVFEVGPTTLQRMSKTAFTLLAKAAVAVAQERTGVFTPLQPLSYQPYRPGVSVPEPRTTERSCPPIGTLNEVAFCAPH